MVAAFGFKLSIGKNLFHDRVCTINTVGWKFDGVGFSRIDYCPVGMILGQSKVSTGDRPLSSLHERIVTWSADPVWAESCFLRFNKSLLDKYTDGGKYNLYLSESLGGLGFKPVRDFYLTPYQRLVASYNLHAERTSTPRVVFRSPIRSQSSSILRRDASKKMYRFNSTLYERPTGLPTYDYSQTAIIKPVEVVFRRHFIPDVRKFWKLNSRVTRKYVYPVLQDEVIRAIDDNTQVCEWVEFIKFTKTVGLEEKRSLKVPYQAILPGSRNARVERLHGEAPEGVELDGQSNLWYYSYGPSPGSFWEKLIDEDGFVRDCLHVSQKADGEGPVPEQKIA
jgi:hypothetical protein